MKKTIIKPITLVMLVLIASIIFFPKNINAQNNSNNNNTPVVKVKKSKVLAIHTNFILPLTRFNFLADGEKKPPFGQLKFFNSLGAGINFSYGNLTETYEENSNNDNIDARFSNAIGIQIGFLFSSDVKEPEPTNIFAPTISFTFLDFQLGGGYELGSRADRETGLFVSLSYGIPLQKLSSKGSWILKRWSKPGNNNNNNRPLDIL
jgi:hypothetical protein